ncbi:hypothetical protein M9Y10_031841 [Tritrichomonas musculus]|uniref:Condensation domain-containing protein n=1 Tax=Tritrichomonas musculus TaxID=1915356 RepID=A0ABR2H003_9EUKA
MSFINQRPLFGKEKIFVNQDYRVYVQIAIQVENPKNLHELLNKIKNATSGLYIKSDGFNLINNRKEPDMITIHKIPKTIKTLSDCCDWIYHTYTPDINYSLASIATDEKRIVINSNHSLTDGGFYVSLLEELQNPNSKKLFTKKAPIPGVLRKDLLQNEFDEYMKNKGQYISHFPSYNTNDITHLNLQETTSLPDSYNLVPKRLKCEFKSSELSPFIYDKKTGKVNHLSEYLWTGLCMAINAKNGEYGPIGVETVMDFRRLLNPEHIDFTFGNTYTNFALCIPNPDPKMTIGQICSQFRNNFNLMRKNDWFFKEFLSPVPFIRENCPAAHVSNVGPVPIRSPLKDIYMQVSGKDKGSRSYLQVTSYSILDKEAGRDDVVLHMGYSPSIVSKKNATDIFNTYVYFLRNVNPDKKSGDVLDELIHFQQSL